MIRFSDEWAAQIAESTSTKVSGEPPSRMWTGAAHCAYVVQRGGSVRQRGRSAKPLDDRPCPKHPDTGLIRTDAADTTTYSPTTLWGHPQHRSPRKSSFHRLSFTSALVATALNHPPKRGKSKLEVNRPRARGRFSRFSARSVALRRSRQLRCPPFFAHISVATNKCALTMPSGHRVGLFITKSDRSSADYSLSWQLRVGFAVGCPFCYHCRRLGEPIRGIPGKYMQLER